MGPSLSRMIRAHAAPVGGSPTVEHSVFGTEDPGAIALWYERLCAGALGSPVVRPLFYASSAGCVAGLELADGRSLVVKAYQPRWPIELLRLCSAAQDLVASAGFPCPIPETEPFCNRGVPSSVDRLLPDPGARVLQSHEMEASAAGLARTASLLAVMDPRSWRGLHPFSPTPTRLYPDPHSPLFDFSLREEEAQWIDELAAAGASARDGGNARFGVFHCDWSARNIRVDRNVLVASYDWDSLVACSESTAAGTAAATWRSTGEGDDTAAPGPDEIDEYVAAYLRCSDVSAGASRSWRRAAVGQALWALAYTARCEHAAEARHPDLRSWRARAVLEQERSRFLTRLAR